MTCNILVKRSIGVFQESAMTMVVETAVALGIVYACVAPWFYCKSDKPEEEFRERCSEVPEVDTSSANQTLTSTNIRVTGLRGLNFVSITLPHQPSSSAMAGYNSGVNSRTRTSVEQSNYGVSVQNPLMTYADLEQKSTVPEIHISSASTDTTTYPLSSKTSSNLLVVRSSKRHRRISTDSNNSRYDEIRSYKVDNGNSERRRLSQSRSKQSYRIQQQKSQSFIRHNQKLLLSAGTSDKIQSMDQKSLDHDEIMTANHFIEQRNSESFAEEREMVGQNSLFEPNTRHSLYPDVNVIIRTSDSSISGPSSSNIHQNCRNAVPKGDSVSEHSLNSQKMIGLNSALVDDSLNTIEGIRSVSMGSQNKSAFSNFLRKKCKKFWISSKKNDSKNVLKEKRSITVGNKNDPTGHSTPIEKSNYSDDLQGPTTQLRYKLGIRQECDGNCDDDNVDIKTHCNVHGPSCTPPKFQFCHTPNQRMEIQSTNSLSKLSKINSQMEMTAHRSLPFRKKIEHTDDEPLDLSIGSKARQPHIKAKKDGNNNCSSESTFMFTFKKRTNTIFTKTSNKKSPTKNKSRSIPEKDFNILKSLTQFCHRSEQDEDKTIRTHISDSTHYPELKSINHRRHRFTSGFLSS